MTSSEFFQEFISPTSYKVNHSYDEYLSVKNRPEVVLVKATTLYQIYKHNVFENEGRLTMQDFFRVCGQYFYYDKYICKHGTEFYYYVSFNKENIIYQATKKIIMTRIKANSPDTLRDTISVLEAMTKEVN